MNDLASIGVLIPTLDCIGLLPGHLDSLKPWLQRAGEVVVVDSQSTDGTIEFLRANLDHPRLRFLAHPRGLYQSWNFGLGHLTTPYAYVSTVGDSITGAGLEHLLRVAQAGRCDVAVSKPSFVDNAGRAMPEPRWPIDDLLELFPDQRPLILEGASLFFFACAHCTEALLGSSASNLYLTDCVKRRPFSSAYGTVGDGAWGIANALDIRMGLTDQTFSTLRHHPKAYKPEEYAVEGLRGKLFALAQETLHARARQSSAFLASVEPLKMDDLMRVLRQNLDWQERLERCRHAFWPWFANPIAWRARRQRNRYARELIDLKESAAARIRPNH
jgi:hypothetical protein